MKKQKNSSNGITLIALVITIIIMLILAGVSISAIVGDDGILARATNAKLISEEAARREALDMMLLDYNSSEFLGEAEGLHKFLSKIKGEGQIGNYAITTDEDYAIIKYGDKNYEIVRESEGSTYYKISDEVDGGILEEGDNFILTQKTLDTEDGFVFENGKSYIVLDEKLTADEFDFNIQAGEPVTIKIMHDMDIDNKDVPNRSAINLEKGATLNLYIYGKVNVNSSFGEKGEDNLGDGAHGGPGGYAGIHVPEGSTLNLYGTGIITAQGGNAGNGGSATGGNNGGAGGGGAGAGIGGNGGTGGDGNWISELILCTNEKRLLQSAGDGKSGENCGNINIYNSLTVYSYGGAGGSGGIYDSASSGTGAGGYPGAGIGGGGAGAGGGDHLNGGGGYSAGVGQGITVGSKVINGGEQDEPLKYTDSCSGGSYFYAHRYDLVASNGINYSETDGGKIGGQGGSGYGYGKGAWWADAGGDGGKAGNGGTVKVSNSAKVYAFNGNRYTDGTDYENGLKQCPIFVQNGTLRAIYKTNSWWNEKENYNFEYFNNIFGNTIESTVKSLSIASEWSEFKNSLIRKEKTDNNLKTKYVNPTTKDSYGIGSGAGYIEVFNGTYTIDSSMN